MHSITKEQIYPGMGNMIRFKNLDYWDALPHKGGIDL